jgi:hypothetical protein
MISIYKGQRLYLQFIATPTTLNTCRSIPSRPKPRPWPWYLLKIAAPVKLEARRNSGTFAPSSWGPLTATVAKGSTAVALSQEERSFPHTLGPLADGIGGVSHTPGLRSCRPTTATTASKRRSTRQRLCSRGKMTYSWRLKVLPRNGRRRQARHGLLGTSGLCRVTARDFDLRGVLIINRYPRDPVILSPLHAGSIFVLKLQQLSAGDVQLS